MVKFVVKYVVKCVVKLKNCWIRREKNWCGNRYGPHNYDSGDKKTKRQKDKKTKRQKGKNVKMQKDKQTKRQKDKKAKRQKKIQGGPNGNMPSAGARTRGP